jgi:hypothetical protein
MFRKRKAESTEERSICNALADSELLSVCIYAFAPAEARHIITSESFALRAFSHSSQFYQPVLADKIGIKTTMAFLMFLY